MKETYKLLQQVASEFKVPEKEVHVRIGEPGFLEFWQFIETGMKKNDQWIRLNVVKINDI